MKIHFITVDVLPKSCADCELSVDCEIIAYRVYSSVKRADDCKLTTMESYAEYMLKYFADMGAKIIFNPDVDKTHWTYKYNDINKVD